MNNGDRLTTEVLVVGGGTGGTAAAIQAARLGAQVLLVSEWPWLGGMLTAAGVSAPDGNELAAFQTGLWGAFLRELERRQPEGLHHGWVSFFTYEPGVGAKIFADWVTALPNLTWRWGHRPKEVLRSGERVTGVVFDQFSVTAQITVDGTELGDLLALGDVPYRWGWETQDQWQEPSAPKSLTDLTEPLLPAIEKYPVQSPTWVVVMQDYGEGATAPLIPSAGSRASFTGAWEGYGPERFLNYGRLPGNRFMINWPQQGNDYGVGLERLIESDVARFNYWQEAKKHSQEFASFIQSKLGRRYGLAEDVFPKLTETPGGGGFALYPYYRESRRLVGITTVSERDILPVGQMAPLPVNEEGVVDAIAMGNYPNDHHYPGFTMPLAPKSIRWGGRWTGTPFTIPYRALVPATIDGLLACDKNISVTHIANGATRLQPIVLGIGQAAGAAAALCVQQRCQPRQLSTQVLQRTLLCDVSAPAMLAPCFNLLPNDKNWSDRQLAYLRHPDSYPTHGFTDSSQKNLIASTAKVSTFRGQYRQGKGDSHQLFCQFAEDNAINLVAISPNAVNQLGQVVDGSIVDILGIHNVGGDWILVNNIQVVDIT